MDYLAPATLDEAYRVLQAGDAACLAGGQSLIAAMNLGLAVPGRLVSLRNIPQLRGIEPMPDGSLRISAMTTHAELAALDPSAAGPALLARAARTVAYPAVRNRGTVGGSVALADPAADYPVALQAADALIEIGGPQGVRLASARSFFRGLFETALEPSEIVLAIHVPPGPAGASCAYEKLALVAGDFAIVSVAALGGRSLDLAVGGCGPAPILLTGIAADSDSLLAAGRALAESCEPASDHRASADYRRRVLPELVRRAGLAAAAPAGS